VNFAEEAASPAVGQPARILVIEPHSAGHHAAYLRWVVEAIVERGWVAVVATTGKALEHPQLRGFARASENVELRLIDAEWPTGIVHGRVEIARRELAYWRSIRSIVRAEQAKADLSAVVLPYLDYCFFACCVLGMPYGGVPWHAIAMRLSAVTAAKPGRVPWRWRLARRLLSARSLSTLFSISPSVQTLPQAWLASATAAKLRYLPDPAEHRGALDRAEARSRLGLEPDQLAVLVFGSIDERKGVARLAAALAGDARLDRYVLVVAGAQTPELRAAQASGAMEELRRRGRLIAFDRTLSDAEQTWLFAAADVAWLGYERHLFMSGVLVLAGHSALPVIATDFGETGAFVRRHGMGLLVDASGSDSVCGALVALMDAATRREFGARSKAAVEEHSPRRLKVDLVAAIESQRKWT
jgi:glycosyltransferase involved in cell wall biosynthesis